MFQPGHIGIGLLVSAMLVVRLGPLRSLWVTLFVLIGTRFPDIDTVVPFLTHHGVMHSVGVAIISSIALGFIIVGLTIAYRRVTGLDVVVPVDPAQLHVTSSGAIFLGQLSHLVADMFSARQTGVRYPMQPFWPFWDKTMTWALIPVRSNLWNYGLLAVGIMVYVTVYAGVHQDGVVSQFLQRTSQE